MKPVSTRAEGVTTMLTYYVAISVASSFPRDIYDRANEKYLFIFLLQSSFFHGHVK